MSSDLSSSFHLVQPGEGFQEFQGILDPVVVECGHTYAKAKYDEQLKAKGKNLTCMFCAAKLDVTKPPVRNLAIDEMMARFKLVREADIKYFESELKSRVEVVSTACKEQVKASEDANKVQLVAIQEANRKQLEVIEKTFQDKLNALTETLKQAHESFKEAEKAREESINRQRTLLAQTFSNTTKDLNDKIAGLQEQVATLKSSHKASDDANANLSDVVEELQRKNSELEDRVKVLAKEKMQLNESLSRLDSLRPECPRCSVNIIPTTILTPNSRSRTPTPPSTLPSPVVEGKPSKKKTTRCFVSRLFRAIFPCCYKK